MESTSHHLISFLSLSLLPLPPALRNGVERLVPLHRDLTLKHLLDIQMEKRQAWTRLPAWVFTQMICMMIRQAASVATAEFCIL